MAATIIAIGTIPITFVLSSSVVFESNTVLFSDGICSCKDTISILTLAYEGHHAKTVEMCQKKKISLVVSDVETVAVDDNR